MLELEAGNKWIRGTGEWFNLRTVLTVCLVLFYFPNFMSDTTSASTTTTDTDPDTSDLSAYENDFESDNSKTNVWTILSHHSIISFYHIIFYRY